MINWIINKSIYINAEHSNGMRLDILEAVKFFDKGKRFYHNTDKFGININSYDDWLDWLEGDDA